MAKKVIDLKKKMQNQNIIIIALAITILVLLVVSGTAAWYITTRTDTVDILLGNPVNPYITTFGDALGEDNTLYKIYSESYELLGKNTRVYPGDQITMELGVQLGKSNKQSSPAYVRVKLVILYENIYTKDKGVIEDMNINFGKDDDPLTDAEGNKTDSTALIEYNKSMVSGDNWRWAPVNFNQDELDDEGNPLPADNWYVLQNTDTMTSRVVYNEEKYKFIKGTIELSEENITNKYANCKFHIQYTVEAIQIQNIEDPITQRDVPQADRTNPWWTDKFIYLDGDNI